MLNFPYTYLRHMRLPISFTQSSFVTHFPLSSVFSARTVGAGTEGVDGEGSVQSRLPRHRARLDRDGDGRRSGLSERRPRAEDQGHHQGGG